MYSVLLAGSIAAGKSTVARILEQRGAHRIDLDDVSRDVTRAGMPVLEDLARVFGADVIDVQTGELRREVLAGRAFATEAMTQALEEVTHPAIFAELERRITLEDEDAVVVVEVPLLDRAMSFAQAVDEVLCVVCPTAIRRARAVERGMSADDFDRRDARQPSRDYLERHAQTIFVNDAGLESLCEQIDAWWGELRKDECNG